MAMCRLRETSKEPTEIGTLKPRSAEWSTRRHRHEMHTSSNDARLLLPVASHQHAIWNNPRYDQTYGCMFSFISGTSPIDRISKGALHTYANWSFLVSAQLKYAALQK